MRQALVQLDSLPFVESQGLHALYPETALRGRPAARLPARDPAGVLAGQHHQHRRRAAGAPAAVPARARLPRQEFHDDGSRGAPEPDLAVRSHRFQASGEHHAALLLQADG